MCFIMLNVYYDVFIMLNVYYDDVKSIMIEIK